MDKIECIAKHFFELGIKAQKGEYVMMCRMFDDKKKRCQEARCEKCKMFSPIDDDEYEPLFDIEYGLGIDH